MIAQPNGFVSIEQLLQEPGWEDRIRRKAKRLKASGLVPLSSIDEVSNDLRSAVWERLHNEQIPPVQAGSFVGQALHCAVVDVVRKARTGNETLHRQAVLPCTEKYCDADSSTLLHDTIEVDYRRRSPKRDLDLEMDVREALNEPSLDARDHDVAVGLQDGISRAAVARHIGVPRSTSYGSVTRLRRVLDSLNE